MRRIALPALIVLASAGGCHRQEPQPSQPAATGADAAPSAPLNPQPMALVTANKGKPAPATTFKDLAANADTTLAAFKGKPLLVNLWATWCGPCVRELPALDALAKREAGRLQVIAISEDMEGARVVQPFLAQHHVATLKPYIDPDNGLLTGLKEASLPVTILYGADGKEMWRVPGDMDWSGAKAKALLGQAGA